MRDLRADQINRDQIGEVFCVPFAAVAYSAQMDFWELLTPANKTVRLRQFVVKQYSDVGDAQSEILPFLIYTGYSVAGSVGGGAFTPLNVDPNSTIAAGTIASINNTTIASGGLPVLRHADGWNVAAGLWFYPPQAERLWIPPSTRLVIRSGAPADPLTINGTLYFEEMGIAP